MTVTTLLTRLPAAIAVSCLAGVLAACAPPAAAPRSPGMDLDSAKQSTRSQQDELLLVVPPAAVSTTKQTATSRALFECETGGYYWPGTLDVVLSEDADGAALLERIKADWSARSGWTVRDKTSANGDPELVIVSEEGYRHAIEFNPGRNALNVLSSSACFQMEEKPEPGVDY
ncbi:MULTISPECIES: hypothetical protein [unclassified Arthrobacter]|uniref:hypothetical protein n=1 Tax=unclassified Arthrobacter TaxID=235627 RepID=UPI002E0C2EA4|nr:MULTISPECIES: hypothetical protein [unclassified Arthrobacter]MEC5191696.1 hypothetical protein [Arthrobacter sp. MP_M4]MEC5203386.1 hypothetical protein [Arthrobacter sp. MP_M7]